MYPWRALAIIWELFKFNSIHKWWPVHKISLADAGIPEKLDVVPRGWTPRLMSYKQPHIHPPHAGPSESTLNLCGCVHTGAQWRWFCLNNIHGSLGVKNTVLYYHNHPFLYLQSEIWDCFPEQCVCTRVCLYGRKNKSHNPDHDIYVTA